MKPVCLLEQPGKGYGLSTTGIKTVALIAMTADHIGKNLWLLLPPWLEIALQILGRCAAPLFAHAVVVGMQHTAHPWRYALRMYAASWVLLLAAAGFSHLLPQSLLRIALLPWPPLNLDYGYLIPLGCIWFFCRSSKSQSLVYGLFCLGMLVDTLWRGSESGNLLWLLFVEDYQWTMVLALPVMYLYNGRRGTGHKWFFYAYYPLHSWLLYAGGIALSYIV